MFTKMLDAGKKKIPALIGGVALASFSILAQYDLPLLSYGIVLLLLYCMYLFLFEGKRPYLNRSMTVFIAFALVQQLLVYMATGTFLKNMNTYLFMFVSLFLLAFACHIDKRLFFKAYFVLGMVCSAIVIVQFFLANILGIPQSTIQILPVSEENQHFWLTDSNRIGGLFTEPQGFSSYILPLLTMLVFSKKYISAAFVSVAIFASTSSQGILLMAFIWAYSFFVSGRNTDRKFKRVFVVAASGIILLLVLSQIPQFSFVFDKIGDINIFGYDIRLTKGFQIFFAMPFWDQIVGIGFGNLQAYLLSGDFNFFWMSLTRPELLGYITTMSNVLISFGVGGFIFYLNVFRANWSTPHEESKVVLLLILISSFTQTILFNAWYLFYWIVFEVLDEKEFTRYRVLHFGMRKD